MTFQPSRRRLFRSAAALIATGALAACGQQAAPAPTSAPATLVPPAEPTVAPTAAPATLVPTVAPTAAPAPTAVPTAAPTAAPTEGPAGVQEFTSAARPVTISHPADWAVADFGKRADADAVGLPEQSLAVTSPDSTAALIVRYYDYKGPGSGDVTGAYVAIQFNENIDRTTVSERSNDDGSMDAEWTFADPKTKAPTHALVRFVHREGSPYTFALLFRAPEASFAELAPVGRAMIESFRESTAQ